MLLSERIPEPVLSACQTLKQGGFAAYVVGGAIRDLLLFPNDNRAKDFDLTTSARPEQVVALFGAHRVIPTGIAHGTVTVLFPAERKGGKPHPIEITTFRGEHGFSDGRRPDEVRFITDLTEDLRRRDFTINAIAFDPLVGELIDPFSGQADLWRGLIRAVGQPAARFAEDGLRVMRAVRFAAQLGFVVEPETRAAFAGALPTLRRVSKERIRDELLKMLRAPAPGVGLSLLCLRSAQDPTLDWGPDRNMLEVVFPELSRCVKTAADLDPWRAALETVTPAHRLLALLWPLRTFYKETLGSLAAPKRALGELFDERLKLPSRERDFLVDVLAAPLFSPNLLPHLVGPPLRRLLAAHSEEVFEALFVCQRAAALAHDDQSAVQALQLLWSNAKAERATKPPLKLTDLALTGKDLLAHLHLAPGPLCGQLLRELLEWVLDDPQRNDKDHLLAQARLRIAARTV